MAAGTRKGVCLKLTAAKPFFLLCCFAVDNVAGTYLRRWLLMHGKKIGYPRNPAAFIHVLIVSSDGPSLIFTVICLNCAAFAPPRFRAYLAYAK